jgi:hypothetical protein
MKTTEKEWLEDFKEFVQSEGAPVPQDISDNILNRVRIDLNPSPWMVFAKLFGVHLVVGTLSLAICSQFGLNPFHSNFSLSEYFMRRREELLVLSRNAPLQVFGLSVLSMVAFIGFGAEVVLGIGILWFVGSMFGGIVAAKTMVWRPVRLI